MCKGRIAKSMENLFQCGVDKNIWDKYVNHVFIEKNIYPREPNVWAIIEWKQYLVQDYFCISAEKDIRQNLEQGLVINDETFNRYKSRGNKYLHHYSFIYNCDKKAIIQSDPKTATLDYIKFINDIERYEWRILPCMVGYYVFCSTLKEKQLNFTEDLCCRGKLRFIEAHTEKLYLEHVEDRLSRMQEDPSYIDDFNMGVLHKVRFFDECIAKE